MTVGALTIPQLLERMEWQMKVAVEIQHYDARVTVNVADLKQLIAAVRTTA